jgi:dTDP-4-dehydrorhamnose reductase
MKILITGYRGQMGTDLVAEIKAKHPEDVIVGIDTENCDITDGPKVMDFVCQEKPDAIMHLAAYTAVDRAESEALKCTDVNAIGTANMVLAAQAVDAKFLYISTDYVFDGTKDGPYLPSDEKKPLSIYGMSKAAGEDAVMKLKKYFIVRTSWVFGKSGHNFIYTMIRLAQSNAPVQVISDVLGSPTYTVHLVKLLDEMIHSEKYGIYHATNEGYTTWFKYTQMIFRMMGYPEDKARPIPAVRYPAPAKRPKNSRLDKQCLTDAGFERLPSVEEAVKEFLVDTGYYGSIKKDGK